MDRQQQAARGSRFFTVSAILIAALVVLSFSITYLLPVVTGSNSFSLLRHLHGMAFFAWFGLYVIQTWLVQSGNIRLHRELGIAGVALAGAMLPLGLWLTTTAAGERLAAGAPRPFEISLYNVVDIIAFSIAFGWAACEAIRRIEWHRRLIFVAALNLLGAAISRIIVLPIGFPWNDMAANLVADALLVTLALHDRRTLGKVHSVTKWAALILVPFHAIEPLIARSSWWTAIAPPLFGFG